MEIDKNTLAQNYGRKSDDELMDLHATGTLTELAYEVLEGELAHRGVAIPKRPETSTAIQQRPQTLRAHWQGKASLASAYWLVGVLGGLLFSMLYKLLTSGSIVRNAWLPYTVFALVSIWRCAWNSSWRGWGYLARTSVVLTVFYVSALFFVVVLL